MSIVAEEQRGSRRGVYWPFLLIAILVVPLLLPWQTRLGRYSLTYHPYRPPSAPYQPGGWGVIHHYANSLGTSGDVIVINTIGPFQVSFLRAQTGWRRPWPF